MAYKNKKVSSYRKIIALIIFSLISFTSLNFDSKSNHSLSRRRNIPISECNVASSILTELIFHKPFSNRRLKQKHYKAYTFFNLNILDFKYFNYKNIIYKTDLTIFETDKSPPTIFS